LSAKRENLRIGFSTGAAATAAAKAAAIGWRDGAIPDAVTIRLPKGQELRVPIAESRIRNGEATAVVVKDAGDDPDVTHGARVGATIRPTASPGLLIAGGAGVGRLTKPGLVLPPGEFAINPTPRAMLRESLAPFHEGAAEGLKATVFIEKGEILAQKTLNPRLGIVGGLSVLGTTGLVRPFSNSAYIATIASALKVARALSLEEAVLATGGRSEGFARAARPDLPEEAFVQIADFFSGGLKLAAKSGFKTIGLAVFFGKAAKQALGFPYTHAHQSELALAPLFSALPGVPPRLLEALAGAPTALAALNILKDGGLLSLVVPIADRVLASARGFVGPGPRLWARIFDFDGKSLAFREA
jgi:cobalt-precorrin-5B (C1)-methyltransferase